MSKLFSTAVWVVAMALTGCARFQPRPLDVARVASVFDSRSLDAPDLRAFMETNLGPVLPWPPAQWDFEQLTLAALFLHPKLDVARAELATVRAAEITAGGRPNPTAGIAPEYNFNPSAGVSPWIAAINFDIPIETAGKRGHRIARAQHLSEATRLRLDSVAWEIRSGVRSTLFDLGNAVRRVDLLGDQLAAQRDILAALEAKLANGAVTIIDVAPLRVALARTEKEISDARVQAEESRSRLASAIGIPLKSLPPVAALATDLPSDSSGGGSRVEGRGSDGHGLASAEARRRALTSRADLLASLAEYAAAEAALRLEMAQQYPDVHLGSGYQFDQGENKWALGFTAEIPVLNRNEGPIAEAKAKRAEAATRVVALQARIVGDVDRALAAWQGARASVAAMEAVRAAQQSRLSSLQAQLEAGAIESLDLLMARAELAADELFHWEAQSKAARAFGELEDAIQFPLPLDLSVAGPSALQP